MADLPRFRVAACLLLLALLSSCVTAPPSASRVDSLLPTDQTAYFTVDVVASRSSLPGVVTAAAISALGSDDDGADLEPVLDRLMRISGSFGPPAYLVATGRFPAGFTRLALSRADGIRRIPAPAMAPVRSLFVDESGNVQIAVLESGLIAISTGSLEPIFAADAAAQTAAQDRSAIATAASDDPGLDGADASMRDAEATLSPDDDRSVVDLPEADPGFARLWVPDPSVGVQQAIGIAVPGLQLEWLEFRLSAFKTDGGTTEPGVALLEVDLLFERELHASLFRRLSRGLILVMLQAYGLDASSAPETVSVEQEGTVVRVSGVFIEDQAVRRLLERVVNPGASEDHGGTR